MSIYIDRKYVGLIQYRLERFVQKNADLYNFRCPLCGDSKKNKSLRRGFIYKLQDVEGFAYKCHNCGSSISFGHFIEAIDPNTYREYVLEKYCNGGNRKESVEKPDFEELRGNAFEQFNSKPKTLSLSKISELPKEHYAVAYIKDRCIPENHWNDIYYTDKFRDFMLTDFPEHTKKEIPNDDRIVLLYTDENGNPTIVAGRALSNTKMRYISVGVVKDRGRKFFGTQRLDQSKPAFVVEGQFDSLFLDNCLATGDSSLVVAPENYPEVDWTLVYDNEPRNKEIVKQIEGAIDKGYKVCIFPDGIVEKDINDMVKAGLDVGRLIAENTVQGASAMMKFIRWKKI